MSLCLNPTKLQKYPKHNLIIQYEILHMHTEKFNVGNR